MTDKLKILIISSSFPHQGDGSESAGTFVYDFCKELTDSCAVKVVAPHIEESCFTNQQFSTYYFKASNRPLSLIRLSSPRDWSTLVRVLLNGRKTVLSVAESWKPDHVLCFWALPCGWWGLQVQKRFGVPYSVWTLGSDIWELGRIPIVKSVLTNVLKKSHHVYSDGMDLLTATECLAKKRGTFLASCRQISFKPESHRRNGRVRLCFIGRWHRNKGIDLLIEALELLDSSDWNEIETVVIAGGGPLEMLVRSKVATLVGQGRAIVLLDYLNKEQATHHISNSDYQIIPSRIESIPVIFSDAIQCETAVISTPVGDLPHFINKYNLGFVAKEVSSLAILEVLKSVLFCENKNKPDFENAKTLFSVSSSVKSFIDVLSAGDNSEVR